MWECRPWARGQRFVWWPPLRSSVRFRFRLATAGEFTSRGNFHRFRGPETARMLTVGCRVAPAIVSPKLPSGSCARMSGLRWKTFPQICVFNFVLGDNPPASFFGMTCKAESGRSASPDMRWFLFASAALTHQYLAPQGLCKLASRSLNRPAASKRCLSASSAASTRLACWRRRSSSRPRIR